MTILQVTVKSVEHSVCHVSQAKFGINHFKSVSHFLLPVASQVPHPPGLRNACACMYCFCSKAMAY